MTILTGAALYQYGTQVTIISDAAGAAANTFSAAGDATNLVQTDFVPLADVTLDITFTSAPTAGDSIILYRRDMNIDGTNDAVEPSANYRKTPVGEFLLEATATRQYHNITDVPLTVDQDFYIEYNTTTVATATNPTVLKLTPKTYNAKA